MCIIKKTIILVTVIACVEFVKFDLLHQSENQVQEVWKEKKSLN